MTRIRVAAGGLAHAASARAGLVLVVLALAACGSGATPTTAARDSAGPSARASSPSSAHSDLSGTVTVLAAASLTEPFTTLADSFEAAHPGVTVRLSFGSSTTLAQQVAQGAPADLFASAGTKALDQLPAEARAKPTATLATNSLEIATPPGNPGRVSDLASLAAPDLKVVLCAATVPCGAAADGILTKAGVDASVVSREIDVRATLAKVTLGEADAAIVYRSDVRSAADKVTGIEIPAAQNTVLGYPLVELTSTPATAAFATYLKGAEGRKALQAAGFESP